MQQPSENWKRIRGAALERAQRTAITPLTPLYTIYASVCVCYFVGFLRFQFFDIFAGPDWITAMQLFVVVISGALVPVLTGSVLTLHVTKLRLDRLVEE